MWHRAEEVEGYIKMNPYGHLERCFLVEFFRAYIARSHINMCQNVNHNLYGFCCPLLSSIGTASQHDIQPIAGAYNNEILGFF